MAKIYGYTGIPGAYLEARESSTTAVSTTFDAEIALVGGYDKANAQTADFTVGETKKVSGAQEAASLFGEGSELHRAVDLAFLNGAAEVYAVPVEETDVTGEDPSSGTSGELANAPIFDPNVNTEHDITDQGGNTINVSYDVSDETISGTEGYVNPVNGNFDGDSGTTYSLDYTYGDYATAIENAALEDVRFVSVLTENASVVNKAITELESRATNFDFKRAVAGIMPNTTTPADYSDNIEDDRMVLTAPSRAIDLEGNEVRLAAPIGGQMTGSALGESTTGNKLAGIDSLKVEYQPTDLPDFGSNDNGEITGVTPVIPKNGFEIVEDRTTATGPEYKDVFKAEILDEAAFLTYLVADDFTSEPNTPESRKQDLLAPALSVLREMATDDPPLLAETDGSTPYNVSIGVGDSDDVATLDVAVSPLDVAKTVKITLSAGDIITYEGAN